MIVLALLWIGLGATLYMIASTHPPMDALVRWAIGIAVACAIGGLLIRSQPLGEATLMGRIGAAFVRWGYRAGQGKLLAAVVISWLVWLVIGATAIWALHFRDELQPLILTLGWAAQVLVLFYLVGMWLANAGADSHFRGRFVSMAAVVLLVLLASVTLWFQSGGKSRIALYLAAIPLAASLLYTVFMAVVLLTGSKARWN